MTAGINTQVYIVGSLKAKLEMKAAMKGMKYREYLVYLADEAVKRERFEKAEPAIQTRLVLGKNTKEKVKAFSKEANCTQTQWLLNVYQAAVQR
jgi:hypothetical protein